jgi:hypothetical protein
VRAQGARLLPFSTGNALPSPNPHTDMTNPDLPLRPTSPAMPESNEALKSGVSWAAVIAGAVVTAGFWLIFLTLGTGLGLSALSPWSGRGASAATVGKAAVAWLVITQVLASAFGGYLAGRLRTKWTHVHSDEVYFRDTAHGLLSWATSIVVTAAFLTSAAAALVGGREHGAEAGVAPASLASAQEDGATGPGAWVTDLLFRSEHPSAGRSDVAVRSEGGRIIAAGLRDRGLSPADKSYLGNLISAQTGLSQSDADRRVADVFVQVQSTIDRDRKAAASVSLWMFLALLGGAFCASFAATIGGRQRDHVATV